MAVFVALVPWSDLLRSAALMAIQPRRLSATPSLVRSNPTEACMVQPDWAGALWRKSVRSGSSGGCVEWAVTDTMVGVRDSQDQQGPVLVFGYAAWRAFINGVRLGEFDR